MHISACLNGTWLNQANIQSDKLNTRRKYNNVYGSKTEWVEQSDW